VHTNRGAPTPPIAFGEGRVGDHLATARVEVDDALRDRLQATGADVSTDALEVAEASRDWWPLAMIWAADGTAVTTAAALVRPATTGDVAEVLRVCNEAHVPVTAAAGRSTMRSGAWLPSTSTLMSLSSVIRPSPTIGWADSPFTT
jgi:alkyldihydroxyacetonephosphate synthase